MDKEVPPSYSNVVNGANAINAGHQLLYERYRAQHLGRVCCYQNYRSFRRDTRKPAISTFGVVAKSFVPRKLWWHLVYGVSRTKDMPIIIQVPSRVQMQQRFRPCTRF